MDYLQITSETLFGFLALFVMTKVLGKSQITQITAFDFIAALVLGELVGNALYDKEVGILDIGYAILLWSILIYTTEMITQKFKGTRKLLEGSPSLVVYKGKIDRDQLKKNKLDVNQLQHLLRAKDVFSIKEVQYAVLETDGTISVLKASQYQNVTRDDMKLAPKNVPLPRAIISDGEVIWDNLREAGFDEKWLDDQLNSQDIQDPSDVMYAEYTEGDKDLYVISL
ncbi:Uncharacterized membrane protein YcaP, DUF421 family [Halobacillus karajensis]|uniref:DUF421 domain-containing protein n=1 Tax=Halobacillus karajensis TaxID=195088 RepID=A0A024P937_9BACI|nr:DUF421 domain-containing protein [Halobacillus karajensis]CDQ20999.1 hypothetical protein BN982_03361 [Halobacillus karajensis]CDQ24937.1 hypothetical protein BN983_03237 [Halobacillus karajensis]CDQ28702.1 hypothetical protein BN981_03016 [Halobacillus karajensis]SEH97700.1 Uncharacterized membrane protein YcaP, DUF421 family [Halobacillus karajensis]